MSRFFAVALLLLLAVLALFLVDIRKTEDGRMPEVQVDGARLPKFDVDVGSIRIEREQRTVNVPEVHVGSEQRQISIPKVEVKGPDEE